MLSEKPSGILSAIGGTVTKRTSVMTPLLVLDFITGFVAVAIYYKDSSWLALVIFVMCLVVTFIEYYRFARTQPWMLSSERIQRYGMQLTLGDNTKQFTQEEATDLQPVDNPELEKRHIGRGKDAS